MLKQLTPQEAKLLIASGDVLIVDVRDQESYEQSHIQKAIHLSIPQLKKFSESTDKKKQILFYCYHGFSSQSAVQYLMDQGFKAVYSLSGGFEIWKMHHSSSIDSMKSE